MKFKKINFLGLKVSFLNFWEVAIIYKDIFIRKEYLFDTDKESPFVLDCGSHVGLSVLWFKKVYPKAKIIAFEPNPNTYKLLKQNIAQNGLKDITTVNAALSNKDGKTMLYTSSEKKSPWTWGDAIVKNKWYKPQKGKILKVRILKLSEYLDKNIDFLKLDIEGAETKVLKEIEPKLSLIREVVMEFHGSSTNRGNDINKILEILKGSGFSIMIWQKGKLIEEKKIDKTDPYFLMIHAKQAKHI